IGWWVRNVVELPWTPDALITASPWAVSQESSTLTPSGLPVPRCTESRPAVTDVMPASIRARWESLTGFEAAGMDWTEVLAAEGENPRARLAAELLASAGYGSTAAQVQAFVEQGGGCRATFFNYRRPRRERRGVKTQPLMQYGSGMALMAPERP